MNAICCWIAKPDFTRIGLFVPLALLAFSVFTQIVYWDVLPLWYHLKADKEFKMRSRSTSEWGASCHAVCVRRSYNGASSRKAHEQPSP